MKKILVLTCLGIFMQADRRWHQNQYSSADSGYSNHDRGGGASDSRYRYLRAGPRGLKACRSISGARTRSHRWPLGIVNGFTGTSKGLALGLLLNYSSSYKGFQLGCVNYTSGSMLGGQVGIVDYVEGSMKGVQFGGVNYAGHLKGVQIGIVNYAASATTGFQIGILNLIPHK